MRRALAVAVAAGLLAGCGLVAGCGAPASPAPGRHTGTLTVFAAASLTGVLEQIAEPFEAAHPGVRLVVSYGASSALARQVVEGAPADLVALADAATMRTVTAVGAAAGRPVTFARNTLQIAVPPGNPGRVTGLADFARPGLRIAVCAEAVPCGSAARRVFAAARVVARPDTLERDVRAVLTKVELGEVDAGMVYRTDVIGKRGAVEGIAVPDAVNVVNDYQAAVLADAPNPELAGAFLALLGSAGARAVLTRAGFTLP